MQKILVYCFIFLIVTLFFSCQKGVGENNATDDFPKLILRKSAIPEIIDGIKKYPLLKVSYGKSKEIADKGIKAGIMVPFPKDPGGGYTHEKHKQNYLDMYNAGLVYQLSGDKKYAVFVRDMLLEYAKLYPTLGIHPEQKNQSPGKLFWQGLNESVWLVYTIQAYDCIHDFLTREERINIEKNLFRKVVQFFTEEDPYSFDRVHNHGTWAVAGVGMTGMVLGDSLMIKEALFSTKLDSSGGFLKQIDELFSPDGYYAEGPYYQRYAMLPFIVFAQALENNLPELKIFEYKGGVLVKSVNTLLQLTDSEGNFYPINDAIKEKSWLSPELIFGTNIVFSLTHNKKLLPVVQLQGEVMLSAEGLAVAKSISNGETEDFIRTPLLVHDGSNGDKGGLALLRLGKNENKTFVLFKFSSQGMGHGHFDRLGFLLYDKGREIIPDYGAARFLNVEAKDGGRYLPENDSWANQTVAHNTLVVNEQSNFDCNLKLAEAKSPHLIFSELNDESIQIVSATDSNCYKGAILNRTMAFFEVDDRRYLIDLFNIKNDEIGQYDLPVYFNGQIIDTNFPYSKLTEYEVLGKKNGYQHLIIEAKGKNLPTTSSVTWMNGKGFYTMSTLIDSDSEFFFTRLGANDPNYNLRDQKGLMFRRLKLKNSKMLTVYEVHGNYNPVSETVMQSEGSIKNLQLFFNEEGKVAVQLNLKNSKVIQLMLDLKFSDSSSNKIQIENKSINWVGNYKLIIN